MEIIADVTCCAECEFVGKESYRGSHVWCRHPHAWGICLPNMLIEIHPDCPIETVKTVKHADGEYTKNVNKYLLVH